jgi:hypothetical protein
MWPRKRLFREMVALRAEGKPFSTYRHGVSGVLMAAGTA